MNTNNPIDKTEIELQALVKLLKEMEQPADGEHFETDNAVLLKERTENEKLRYQLKTLKRSIAAAGNAQEPATMTPINPSKGVLMLDKLNEVFMVAIQKSFPEIEIENAVITRNTGKVSKPKKGKGKGKSKGNAEADKVDDKPTESAGYQCCASMGLVGKLKAANVVVKGPVAVAETILSNIPQNDYIDKLEIGGPGFINIYIKKSFVNMLMTTVMTKGVLPPPVKKRRVMVDFSSPNIAKEMHVGHLRSTIIGETISRMLEFLGHDVKRVNHIGDWGTQFGMLVENLKDKFPNFKTESPPIKDLQAFYKESKKRFDEEPEFKIKAYRAVETLQSGSDESVTRAWQLIVDVSRQEFMDIYKRLDVTIEEKGESFYQSRMIDIIKELEERNEMEEHPDTTKPGCKILWTRDKSAKGNIPLIMVKSGGGYTYDTSDMATIKYRATEEKADWIVYVVDSGQSLHFEMIFEAARKLGYVTPETRLDHCQFGVVLGEDGKRIKSRSGDTITLKSLLDEGLMRAGQFRVMKTYSRSHPEEECSAAAIYLEKDEKDFGITFENRSDKQGVYIQSIEDGGAVDRYNKAEKTKASDRLFAGDHVICLNSFDALEVKAEVVTKYLSNLRFVRFVASRLKADATAPAREEKAPELNDEETLKADTAIAYSSIKYADLSQKRTGDYVFSYDNMLADRGNTATYCINAYARIRQVLNQPEVQHIDLSAVTTSTKIVLDDPHPAEWKLAQHLVRFPDAISMASKDLLPNILCDYLYELSSTCHEFFEKCYVIQRNKDKGTAIVNEHRLYEYATAAKVMEKCFELVGLQFVAKM